ncbi:MAG TPA: hypothetical protein VN634_11390 [Candidatus Limnocylindrales bacterium]|nr:hypothetical protein [Candidatus Limnocylindrales bacterium]
MRTRRFLFVALLLHCAPASASALAQDAPCLDPLTLENGRSYRLSEEILLAPSAAAQPDRAVGFIPSGLEFTIARVVHQGDTTFYYIRTDDFRWGWVGSRLLADKDVETAEGPPPDADEQMRVRQGLDEIARDYAALGNSPSVRQLVALDVRIRKLVKERSCCGFDTWLDPATTSATGTYVGHYATLGYTGKLLGEAHRIDPRSPLRASTLYSTVERYPDEMKESETPDLPSAIAYLREFPKGPFAADAAMALAKAYADAWSSLGSEENAYCMPHQLGDVKNRTGRDQRAYAKKMAESWFQRSFRLRKPTSDERAAYEEWHGSDSYFFFNCPC